MLPTLLVDWAIVMECVVYELTDGCGEWMIRFKKRISIDLPADALRPSDSHRADTKISEFCRLSRSRLRACLRPCLVGSARDAVGAGVAAGRARPLVATRGAEAPHVLAAVTVILSPRPTPHPAQSIPSRLGRNRPSIRSIVHGALLSGSASYCSSSGSPHQANPRLTKHSNNGQFKHLDIFVN